MWESVKIIAEIGVNHNGNLQVAERLVDVAFEAGADIVKFQTFNAQRLATKKAATLAYQSSLDDNAQQIDLLTPLELDEVAHHKLMDHCARLNIEFLSSPFDISAAEFLNSIGVQGFKIASGEITNFPMLRRIAAFDKYVILSTGMSNLSEVKAAVELFDKSGFSRKKLFILHCTSEYPTPFNNVNLNVLNTLKREFGGNIGYSDHTVGKDIALAAVAMGAKVIEKHITLDKENNGPDHKASMSPKEFRTFVKSIRQLELAMGDGLKFPTAEELINSKQFRRSIVASRFIKAGEVFSNSNLTTKRPATGICPSQWEDVIGKRASSDFEADDLIWLAN